MRYLTQRAVYIGYWAMAIYYENKKQ